MSLDDAESTPPYAKLPGGVSLDDVSEAIAHSGYPFQADVAHLIKQAVDRVYNVNLNLQEEWTYVDAESDQVRSLDTLAGFEERQLAGGGVGHEPLIAVSVAFFEDR